MKIEPEKPNVNMIGTGTRVQGSIETDGDLRIDGLVNGEIKVKGKLVVGSSGSIEGNVHCQNADISGKVKGDIYVENLLVLKNQSYLDGNIFVNKLSIEQGANFQGTCKMNETSKPNPINKSEVGSKSERA